MNQAGTFLPPPREVRAVMEGLQTQNPALPGAKTAANGLFYGQYHAPITEYIFPENIPGTPIVENNFNSIDFLTCGGYSSSGIDFPPTTPVLVTLPLSTWPSNVFAPRAGSCTNFVGPQAVTATASPTPARTGQNVNLASTATNASTFAWTNAPTNVPQVVVTNANRATARFVAPAVPAGSPSLTLDFTVKACNAVGCNSSIVAVTVTSATPSDLVAITSALYRTQNQRLILSATDSVISPTVALTVQPYRCEVNAAPCVNQGVAGWVYNPDPLAGGVGNSMTNNGGGLYIITMNGAPRPACNLGGNYATPCSNVSLKVQSNQGGVGTSALTRIR
jgi:hypothetical protein